VPATGLSGNLLGDPTEVRVAVYLPPGYATSPQRRYPALYLLHGYTGDIDAFIRGYQLACTVARDRPVGGFRLARARRVGRRALPHAREIR
jgi:hypothetical protein